MFRYPTFTPIAASMSRMDRISLLRGSMMALLIVMAMLIQGGRPAVANSEATGINPILAEAPVAAGVAAAESGRLRDAIDILGPHAARGHTLANYVLGLIHFRDRGALRARPAVSHRHFARAAASGHVASIFEVAFQFERGIGTNRNREQAIRLYQVAASANHLNAQFNLAVLLSHQTAGREQLQQAYFWAIAARHNAIRKQTGRGGDDLLSDTRITRLAAAIRSRIPHQAAAQASSAAARLTGQPV